MAVLSVEDEVVVVAAVVEVAAVAVAEAVVAIREDTRLLPPCSSAIVILQDH